MWRKIHSNRDPGHTLWSALQTEFGLHLGKWNKRIALQMRRFPRQVFGSMVLLLTASLVLTFTVFSGSGPAKKNTATHSLAAPLGNGLERIIETGTRLEKTIRLKKLVDSIASKKVLDQKDSATLRRALDSLRNIQPVTR